MEEILNSGAAVHLSRVGIVEVAASFFKKTKTGEMQRGEAVVALEEFRSDMEEVYDIAEIRPETAEEAIGVAARHRLQAHDCQKLEFRILNSEF